MSSRPSISRAVTETASPGSTHIAPDPSRRAGGAAGRSTLRPLLLRLHFYAGLFIAPFLLVAAVTGLAYTAMPQIESIVHRDVLRVPASDRSVPLTQQVQAARSAHPEGTIASVTPAPGPRDSTRVQLAVDGLGDGYGRTVFVNPHTGAVLGAERTFGQWLPVRAWVDELHRTLHLGNVGRMYSELAASWLWVIALGGVALWWGRRRTTRGKGRPGTGRRRLLRLHTTVGLLAVVGLLGLSATGMTWSQYAGDNIAQLRGQLSMQTPTVDTGPAAVGGEHAGHAGHGEAATAGDMSGVEADRTVQLDQVVAAGKDAGMRDPMVITMPTTGEGRFAVQENHRSWPERQDALAVDGNSGRVTDRVAFADWPLAAKLAEWGVNAHMGLLFGLANQIVLALIAIALITLIVLGYRMWFERRPTKRRAIGGKPFPRGTWRHAPKRLLAALLAGAVLVGWFMPLLSLSLLAFLTIDAVIGARAARGRRAARRPEL